MQEPDTGGASSTTAWDQGTNYFVSRPNTTNYTDLIPGVEDTAGDLPDWASCTFNATAWTNTLNYFRIDELAQQELFILAQMGDRGVIQAAKCVGKLLKKASDVVPVRNPSGFLHTIVKNATEELCNAERRSRA